MRIEGMRLTRPAAVLALLTAALPVAAAVYAPITDDELLRRSPVVVVGQSLGSRPSTDCNRWPEILTRFSVVDGLKGSVATEIDVAVPGGPLPNGLYLHVPDVPRFTPTGQYLLFLYQRPDGIYGVSEMSLGSFEVLQSSGGKKFATREAFRGNVLQPERLRDLGSFGGWVRSGAKGPATYARADLKETLSLVTGGMAPLWNSSWGGGTAFRWNGTPTAEVSVRNEVPGYGGQSGVAGAGGGFVYEFGNAISWWVGNATSTIRYTRGADSAGSYSPTDLPGPGLVWVYANNVSQFGTAVTVCDGSFSGILAMGAVLTDSGTHTYKNFTWTNVLAGLGWTREIVCSPGSLAGNDFENMMTTVVGNTLGLSNNPQTRHPADIVAGDEGASAMNVYFSGRPTGLGSDDVDAVCFLYGACDPLAPPTFAPVAHFTVPPLPMVKSIGGTFNDTSENTPTSWAWSFGDGTQSTTRSPSHAFGSVGRFVVSLTATNSKGNSTTTNEAIVKTNMAGALAVTSAPAGTASSLVVTLSAGSAGSAIFDFGDGTSTQTVNGPASTFTVSHTYSQYGTFYPKVQLRDANIVTGGATSDLTDLQVSATAVTFPVPCNAPGTPVLTAPATALPGQDVLLSWTAVTGFLPTLDDYVVEVDRDPGFGSAVKTTYTSKVPSFTIPTSNPVANNVGQTLYARLRAVKGCATPIPGSYSNTTTTPFVAPQPIMNISILAVPSAATAYVGSAAPAPATVTYQSSPTSTATATVTLTQQGGAFYTPSVTSFTLAPGTTRTVNLTWTSTALATPAVYSGTLLAAWTTGSVSTNVSLQVYPTQPVPPVGVVLGAVPATVTFEALAGQNPAAQTVAVSVTPAPGATNKWYLSRDSVPSWLSVAASCTEAPTACAALQFPPSGTMTLTLTVDRSRRSPSDLAPMIQGLLGISVVGAIPATFVSMIVSDYEPLPIVVDAGGDLGGGFVKTPPFSVDAASPAGGSFVVPTVTLGKGLFDASFTSNGWAKNVSSTDLPLKIYYIPEGKNGTTDPGTLAVQTTVKAGQTLSLTDVLGTYFGLASGNGRLEIRSSVPQAFSVRTAVDAQTGTDATKRFATEVPTSAWGKGTALAGSPLVIPAVSEGTASRTNLILAETTGSAATVEITVYDAAGSLVGTLGGQAILPYSKIQLQRIVDLVKPGTTLAVGSLSVRVTAGTGIVVALATPLDNLSNSFSAVEGRAVNLPGAAPSLVIPAAARLLGAYNTVFQTNLNISNGTADPATVNLTFRYIDQDQADLVRTVTKSVTLAGHASLTADKASDAIKNLFGITNRVYGWIRVDGDAHRVVIAATNSTLVDPLDAAKGQKASQVPQVPINAQMVVGIESGAVRFPGTEKSSQRRTNAMVVEVTGKPVTVRLSASDAAGTVLARKDFTVTANQYFQITDIFGSTGLGLGAGPFQNVELSAQVVSGAGRIVSFVTVVDNLAKSPQLYFLLPPGPPL